MNEHSRFADNYATQYLRFYICYRWLTCYSSAVFSIILFGDDIVMIQAHIDKGKGNFLYLANVQNVIFLQLSKMIGRSRKSYEQSWQQSVRHNVGVPGVL